MTRTPHPSKAAAVGALVAAIVGTATSTCPHTDATIDEHGTVCCPACGHTRSA